MEYFSAIVNNEANAEIIFRKYIQTDSVTCCAPAMS